MEASALLPGVRRVHFIGIGGSGMCSLAEILHAMGYEVSGSDDLESDNVARLRSLVISVSLPLAARNIRDPEAVVYTVAVSDTHPEMQAAKALGVPVIERAALLGMLTRHYPRSLAVAGTHGKTTTTSWKRRSTPPWSSADVFPSSRQTAARAVPISWCARLVNSRTISSRWPRRSP